MTSWEITITGCGTSHGNPPWGLPGQWSEDPRDLRRRSGALLRGPKGEIILIDAGPDLMHQMRDPARTWDGRSYPQDCIIRCDGLLLTHDHADHCHGLNDLRHLNRLMGMRPIPVYGDRRHLDAVARMFPFCFGVPAASGYLGYAPNLIAMPLDEGVSCTVAGLAITTVGMLHGPAGPTTGFRCGTMAYLTDLKKLPEAADAVLSGLELLVLDMLREESHDTHLCWAEALAIIARLKPRQTVLTHMGHEVRYAAWQDRLPPGVLMAYDGLRLPFPAI